MRQCTKCGKLKDDSFFYVAATGKDGLRSDCKECNNIKTKNWYFENKEKKKEYLRKKTYGISKNEYDLLLEKQKGCCAICGAHQNRFIKPLYVDHCHAKGTIRGLLCMNCNTALGHIKDDVEILKSMVKYLENKQNA